MPQLAAHHLCCVLEADWSHASQAMSSPRPPPVMSCSGHPSGLLWMGPYAAAWLLLLLPPLVLHSGVEQGAIGPSQETLHRQRTLLAIWLGGHPAAALLHPFLGGWVGQLIVQAAAGDPRLPDLDGPGDERIVMLESRDADHRQVGIPGTPPVRPAYAVEPAYRVLRCQASVEVVDLGRQHSLEILQVSYLHHIGRVSPL